MSGLTAVQIIFLIISAILIGINKTGIPGLGLIPVVLLANAFEPGISTGLQLGMLCLADVAAVIYYRRNANWKIVLRLLPSALAGLAAGYFINVNLPQKSLNILIGSVVIFLCILSMIRELFFKNARIPSHPAFSITAGFLGGFTTLTANAAGPVMALYLLSMKLEKKEYVGTGAWYFLILNWIKLPVFCFMGRITAQSALCDLSMIPLLFAGAFLGILFVDKVPQKGFNWIILILSTLGAIKLLL